MTIKAFPTQDLLPKTETNASAFVAKYPSYNGKDITIGILDTGVDPGAIGLSVLPDSAGGPKLVHVADCTGSGDVTMGSVQKKAVKEEGRGWVIPKGCSPFGVEIVLNEKLNLQPFPKQIESNETKVADEKDTENDDDDADSTSAVKGTENDKVSMPVRIALKRAYELFPKKLVARVKKHYAREFDKKQHELAVSVRSELVAWKAKYGNGNGKQPTKEQIRQRDDIMARLDILEGNVPGSDPLKEDPGPLYQIILFYDGKDYRVIVDSETDAQKMTGDITTSDLSALPISRAMTDYHKEFQYGTFSNVDMLNYAVNIYENGKVVSIVVDAGAHGSHVAGIAARYHPSKNEEHEEANGVAPGAKIVSLKIGDTRLGSMETGTAMTRAMIEAVKHKCDVINLSYGEGCVLPNTGRFVQLAEELVYKHGIVFVSSAGNNGPALTTVGAPGGTTDAILSVAAYVSPAMMQAEYSMEPRPMKDGRQIEDNIGTTYTWSSVGPTADGAMGVDITAPGAAITCVPNWCLQRNQLMNGTSMSSPNATGCVALLLSAAKAEGIDITPTRLKRALMNSAQKLPGLTSLQQGVGMLDVEAAWEYIKSMKNDPYEDVNYKVRIINRRGNPRGVYLRQAQEVATKQTFSVQVDPIFATNDNVDIEVQKKRIEFEMKFKLEATDDFVIVPDFFMLMHNGRSFKFEVDPTNLDVGVHTAKVYGFDAARPEEGPKFFVPVTITKPLDESLTVSLGELEFAPNEVKRFFLNVPSDATWMDVTIKDERTLENDKETSSRLIVLHTLQLLPHNAYRDAEEKKYLNLLPSQETVTSIPLHPGITCELDLGRYWSAQGATRISVSVQFRGVTTAPDTVTMLCGGGGSKLRLHSNLSDEFVSPKAKLTKWKRPLSPKGTGIISPCDKRDVLISNNKQIYQLVLTYEFEHKEKGNFIPRAPAVQGVLYESAYESQMILVFDEDKRLVGVADSWPDEVTAPKGKITIRMQIRHDDVQKLELLKNIPLWLEKKLSKEISLPVYGSRAKMITNGSKWNKSLLRQGTSAAVFFGNPSNIPSECKCGDVLEGSATFADGSATLPGAGKKPGGIPVTCIVGPKVEEEKKEKAKTPELPDERSVDEKVEEAIRSTYVKQLQNLVEKKEDKEKFLSLYDTLIAKYPEHLPLLAAALKFYDKKDSRMDCLEKVEEAANAVISAIDEVALAGHFGLKHNDEDAKSCKLHKECEEKKNHLIDALARKARAIADMEALQVNRDDSESFEKAMQHLSQWESIDSKKHSILSLSKSRRAGQYGLMLKLLTSLLENKGDDTKGGISPLTKKEIIEERRKVLASLNFTHLQHRDSSWEVATSLKEYAPF